MNYSGLCVRLLKIVRRERSNNQRYRLYRAETRCLAKHFRQTPRPGEQSLDMYD